MKLSHLLASRSALLRQAALANAAFAYATFADWARRIERARLHGPVRLLAVDRAVERYVPQLIALRGNQSVLDEHFDETDLLRLSDALVFVTAGESELTEFEFPLEELYGLHASSLRESLREAGVELGDEPIRQPDAS